MGTSITMGRHRELSVLVAGDFMIDQYLYSVVSRISPEAPVPVARVRRVEQRIGGAGNVALNIIALESRVKVLSCIGADATGTELMESLEKAGAEVTHLCRDPGRQTSRKTRVVAQNQQLLRYDEEEILPAPDWFSDYIQEHLEEILDGVKSVILSDYGKGVLTPEVSQRLIRGAKERGIPVLVDPKGSDYSKYSGVSMCTPNLKELAEASGRERLDTVEQVREAALAVCNQNDLDYLLATRSEKGMLLVSRQTGEAQNFPAVEREVSDVTGAGDTVISTMAVSMAAGYPLDSCCRLANIAASIVVSKFGAATATVAEINRAIQGQDRPERGGGKICDAAKGAAYARRMRGEGKRVVFTNGCFDLVHAGHIASFREARGLGDVLIVGVNSDGSVRRLKGAARPVVTLENRMRLLEALEMVDCVIPFEEDTPQALIEAIQPDVLVKGKDWEGKPVAGAGAVEAHGGHVAFVELEKGLSTTAIVEKILELNR